jgi:ATP-dependent DNA helicase RecG
MDLAELRELIRQGKGQVFDWYPRDVPVRDLAASMVALANSAGGTVLIGLTPRVGRPQGLHDPEAAIDKALTAALSTTPPLIIPLPRIIEMDGRAMVSITVPPGLPHVYSLDGKYLNRGGADNAPMKPRALRRLMMARGELRWEAQIPDGVTLDDLDWDAVSAYLERLDLLSDVSPEMMLLRRGCLAGQEGDAVPTFAGLLLFGRDPQRWVRGAEIEIARFSGREMGDAFVRQTISGTLSHQLRQAEAFLADNVRSIVRVGSGMMHEEQPQFPLEAAREALVNAVAHRDYDITGDQIRVFLFADRLEVTSPGGLPGPVTLENIADERFSRNEVIVQILADMGFIERLGYGIDRMMRLMKEHQLPPPRFKETGGGFRAILMGADDPMPAPSSAPNLDDYDHVELNQRQEQALAFVLVQRRITSRDYQTLCPEVHPETLRRDLVDLVRRDILLKVGDKRATYYILKRPDKERQDSQGAELSGR